MANLPHSLKVPLDELVGEAWWEHMRGVAAVSIVTLVGCFDAHKGRRSLVQSGGFLCGASYRRRVLAAGVAGSSWSPWLLVLVACGGTGHGRWLELSIH